VHKALHMEHYPSSARSLPRFPIEYPVIFGGAPFVGEGTVANMSRTGCAVLCNRTVLSGSYLHMSMLLPGYDIGLLMELCRIRWVHHHSFGVEFITLPRLGRHLLDQAGWQRLISLLEQRSMTDTTAL
jgi:hypothetical protein